MNPLLRNAIIYGGQVNVAGVRAGWITAAVALLWLLFPFAMSDVLHPVDWLRMQDVMMGVHPNWNYTTQQLSTGFLEALFFLATISLCELCVTVLFYRRSHLNQPAVAAPPLWPLAAVVIGGIGNLGWILALGYVDPAGIVVGFTSAALAVGCEMFVERMGRQFIYGPVGFHPPVAQPWQ